jgi:hypothetical protein
MISIIFLIIFLIKSMDLKSRLEKLGQNHLVSALNLDDINNPIVHQVRSNFHIFIHTCANDYCLSFANLILKLVLIILHRQKT